MVVICPVLGLMWVGTMKLCLKSGPLYYTSRGESIDDNAPLANMRKIFDWVVNMVMKNMLTSGLQ